MFAAFGGGASCAPTTIDRPFEGEYPCAPPPNLPVPVAQLPGHSSTARAVPPTSLVNIFVFSAYFSSIVVADAVRGQVLWSYTSSLAALLVGVVVGIVFLSSGFLGMFRCREEWSPG